MTIEGERRARGSEVVEWWLVTRDGIARVRDAALAGRPLPDSIAARARGKPIEPWFAAQLDEADVLGCFALLAEVEAVFMRDYRSRTDARRRDELSRALLSLRRSHEARRQRVVLDPDILECWATSRPSFKKPVGFVRGLFKYRHWIAHGRYWTPQLAFRRPPPPDQLEADLQKELSRLGLEWR